MTRHPVDLVSLVLGLVVLAVGVAALTGDLGELLNRPAAAVPIALALVGLAAITSARRPLPGPAETAGEDGGQPSAPQPPVAGT